MNGRLLSITAKYLAPLLVAFSLFSLLRGHDAPGGGFIGGLTAAVAFGLLHLSLGKEGMRRYLPFDARSLMGIGLLIALAASVWSLFSEGSFFSGVWLEVDIWGGIGLSVGTPLLFDAGVYLVVVAVLMIILDSLTEE